MKAHPPSLRRDLLLPIVLIGMLGGGAMISVSARERIATLQESIAAEAESLAASVVYSAETVRSVVELRRFVAAVAADPQVDDVLVVGGTPPRVIASRNRHLLDVLVQDLVASPIRNLAMKSAILGAQRRSVYDGPGRTMAACPLVLSLPEISAQPLSSGAVVVAVDASARVRMARLHTRRLAALAGFLLGVELLIIWLLIERRLLRPTRALGLAMERRRNGDTRVRAPVHRSDELGDLAQAFNEMLDEIESQRIELRRLAAVASNTNNGVVLMDAIGRVQWVNDGYVHMTGFTLEDVRGKQIVGCDDRSGAVRDGIDLARAVSVGFELETLEHRRDGRPQWRFIDVKPMRDEHGGPGGFLAVYTDVTRIKETEVALRRAKEDAEAAARSKADFLATMSHEIRTPMNGVIGMTDLLLNTQLSAEQREFAGTVRRCGDALLHIINDILDFSKIEAGKLELDECPFDLRDEIEAAIDMVADRAHDHGTELIIDIHPAVPTQVSGDPGRLRQVLLNLVGNAIKFTRQGRVHIIAERTAGAGDRLRFEVRDTGIGIPRDKQDRLFEPFTQAEAGIQRRFGGTGLGLAISRKLVERMGGAMGLTSEPGEGSTFWFDVRLPTVSPPPPASHELAGSNIAIDLRDPVLLEVCGRWFARSGARVVSGPAIRPDTPIDLRIAEDRPDDPATGSTPTLAVCHRSDLGQPHGAGHATLCRPLSERRAIEAARALLAGESPRPSIRTSDADAAAPIGNGARILVVEDNAVNQRLARAVLEGRGHQVTIADNGKAAIDEAHRTTYDLILMDCQMPIMNGFDATRALRAAGIGIPIIALTAQAMTGDREQCLEAGMNDYITKPFRAADIDLAIGRWLRPAPT